MEGDDQLIPRLQFDVELELEGPSGATLNKWAADALRRLADSLEKEEFEEGWHEVRDNVGKPIGKVYVDYSAETI